MNRDLAEYEWEAEQPGLESGLPGEENVSEI